MTKIVYNIYIKYKICVCVRAVYPVRSFLRNDDWNWQ